MDVTLHWQGEWPEFLAPLLTALEALPETADAADGEVVLCPDASVFAPPPEPAAALVAGVPDPGVLLGAATRDALVSSLRRWAERGAVFTTTTPSAATTLRSTLELSADRVFVVPLPLPAARVPPAFGEPGDAVLAVGPVAYGVLLPAVSLLGLADLRPRVILGEPGAAALVRPGGVASTYGLVCGRDVVAVEDWRGAASAAAAIVLFDPAPGTGQTLREALATGRPVVAPACRDIVDHLAAAGAHAYLYAGARDVAGLAHALAAALRDDRGAALGRAARDAVLSESVSDAARSLFRALEHALAPDDAEAQPHHAPARPARPARPAAAGASPRLAVTVLNPHPSGGGGERFMRRLVHAMASHASAPEVKLVCAVEPYSPFDPGREELAKAGVDVRTVPSHDFARAAAREVAGADVVYCSWPHLTEPPVTPAPLVCTFHDLNWKHFDVYDASDKMLLEKQTPRWTARVAAMVHSSEFIRDEMAHFYGVPASLSHVIPLTAESGGAPLRPVELARARRRFALPERFLLSPAGRHLHKNYAVLEAAVRLLRDRGCPVTVVATGAATDIHHHGPDLIGLGYIDERELQALYELSSGMVQTSLYEAGSFPMWEAMAAHRPVAISGIAPVVEQVERLGAVVELFDPLDPEDVAGALQRLWDGSPATAPEALAANAAAVAARTWDDVAGDYLSLFEAVRAGHRAEAA